MGIPKQLLEQEAAADEAIAQEQARLDALSNPPQPPVATDSPIAIDDPVPPVMVAEPVDAIVSNDDLQKQVDRERQLRKTLEGRLKSQLKPANEEVRRLRAELSEAQEEIQKVIAEGKKPGAERFLSEDEADELGDVLEVNSRMVKGILEEELESGAVAEHIKALIAKSQQVNKTDPVNSVTELWNLVEQYSEGAKDINRNDPRWVDYLEGYSAVTGVQHRDAANHAIDNDDAIALSAMFDDFKRINGATSPDLPGTPKPPAVRPEKVLSPATDLVSQFDDETWSQAEVSGFYNDLTRGVFKGRESEAQQYEERIMAAAQAGRIT